jgi:aerobic-type carbon monoxide dehydrogenase small subunit (CoxS/CutS family)
MGEVTVRLTVNGHERAVSLEPRVTLADFLREECRLTGTHLGCEHGVCGACTVIVDGRPARSCLMLAVEADGATITTVEGIAPDDGLHPVQQAMMEEHGLQCGFCTPGFVVLLYDLLQKKPDATEADVRDQLGGNICRCTGYQNILNAAMKAIALSKMRSRP